MRQVGCAAVSVNQNTNHAGIFLGFLANLLVVIYVKNAGTAWRI